MTRAVNLACVGHLSLDHVFEIERFSTVPSDKTPARAYRPVSGGMSANAAIAAARLGAQVRFFGAVGDDEAGRFALARLAAEGITTAGVQRVTGGATSVSAVVVDAEGNRKIFNHRGNALTLAGPLDTAALAGADFILSDPRWAAGAEAALRWAKEHGVPAMFDGDIAPADDLQRLGGLAAWAVFSAPGLALLAPGQSRDDGLAALLAAGARHAVVTDSEQGLWWRSAEGSAGHLAAFPVSAMDTTGAGDVFHAGLAVALAEGRPVREALRFGAAAAALKCARPGGIAGAPTRAEVEALLSPP